MTNTKCYRLNAGNLKQGFTLIEVMLAIAVFAIAGVALLGAAENNFRQLGLLEQTTIAQWVASNQLVEATLDNTWPPKNNQKGSVEMSGTRWFWTQRVKETSDSALRMIVIEVRLEEKAEQSITELSTYVAKATP